MTMRMFRTNYLHDA